MHSERGRITISSLVLVLAVAGIIWNIWVEHGKEIYEFFRTKQPADLVVASGYDEQTKQALSFIAAGTPMAGSGRSADPLVVQQRKELETAFDPLRITSEMIRYLDGQLRQKELDDGLAWLKSPLGIKVVTLENLATTVDAHTRIQLLANQTLSQQAQAERIDLITGLIAALKPRPEDQLMVFPHRLAINLAVTQTLGGSNLKRVGIVGRGLSYAYDITGETLYHQFVTALLFAYKDLSDDELREYIAYLESPAGHKVAIALCGAYQKALANAMALYAEVLQRGSSFRREMVLVNPIRTLNVRISKFGIVTRSAAMEAVEDLQISAYSTTHTLPVIAEQTPLVMAVLHLQFGIHYVVEGESGSRRVPVRVRVRHPPIQDPQTETVRTTHEWTAIPRLGREAFAGWTFRESGELVPGRWTVQICYQGEVLAEQAFEVESRQAPSAAAALVAATSCTEEEAAPAQLRMAQINKWALAPGGRYLMLLATDNRFAIWDLEAGKNTLEPVELGYSQWPWPRFAVDPRGQYVLTSTQDQRLQMRLLDNGSLIHTLEETAAGYLTKAMAISSSGAYILTLHDDDQIQGISTVDPVTSIWRAADGARITRIVGCDLPVIDPLERYVAGASLRAEVVAYDLETGHRLFTAGRKRRPAGTGTLPPKLLLLLPSPAGNRLLAIYSDGQGLLLDTRSGRIVREVSLAEHPVDKSAEQWLAFDSTGRYFSYRAITSPSRIWSAETGSLVCSIQSPRGSGSNASEIWVHPEKPLAVALLSSEALVYDLIDGHLVRGDYSDHLQSGPANGVIDPSFQYLVTDRAGEIKLIDMVNGRRIDDFGRGGKIFSLQDKTPGHPYGYPVVQTDETDGSFHLWNPFTGEPIADPGLTLVHHELQVQNGRAVTLNDPTWIRVHDLVRNRFQTIQVVMQK